MSNRFGFAAPGHLPIEESIRWAGANDFHYIDFNVDNPPNALDSFDADRVRTIRALCQQHEVALGIHPSSAINSAEYVPILAEAVDEYLFANLDLAQRLGCSWLVAHGGYHFGDVEKRMNAALERTQRLLARAEQGDVLLYFENHNKEPDRAEIHYIPHNVVETRWFLERLDSSHCRWAFNVAHAHLVPEDWAGFLDAFGADRIGQVRLNDNTGEYEVHLVPGAGNIDFPALFAALRAEGFDGQLNLGFGNEADKVRVRNWFAELL